jgi:hypothetical protein
LAPAESRAAARKARRQPSVRPIGQRARRVVVDGGGAQDSSGALEEDRPASHGCAISLVASPQTAVVVSCCVVVVVISVVAAVFARRAQSAASCATVAWPAAADRNWLDSSLAHAGRQHFERLLIISDRLSPARPPSLMVKIMAEPSRACSDPSGAGRAGRRPPPLVSRLSPGPAVHSSGRARTHEKHIVMIIIIIITITIIITAAASQTVFLGRRWPPAAAGYY